MARNIFLIAGPSGSGKTTLTQELVQRLPELTKAVTVTTRDPRPGEIPGVDYRFVTAERFAEIQQSGELIESDHAYNESYGMPKDVLDIVGDVAIVITINGALALRRQMANTISIFVMPDCLDTATSRVLARNSRNAELRIARYQAEILASRHFDHVILNLDFSRSLRQIEEIILGRRGMIETRIVQAT